MHLDPFDLKLLHALQEDASRTAQSLSAIVPLSASAIQRRIRRLREEGIIAREVAILDSRRAANLSHYVVSLVVERERKAHQSELRRWLATKEEVQQIYYVTGEADYVLIICCASVAQFDQFMSRLMEENPNAKRFTTNVALSVLKQTFAIPIEDI